MIGKQLLGKTIISFDKLLSEHINKFIVVGVQKSKKLVYDKLISSRFNRVGIIENDEQFYYYLQFPRWKFDITEITSQADRICQAFNILADQKSRDIFTSRLSTLTSYADFASYKRYCQFSDFPKGYPEDKKVFASNYENQMYFDNDLVVINSNEVNLVDCGAYDGDSFIEFQNLLKANHIENSFAYCFEPDFSNYQRLQINLKDYKNVKFFNMGVWNEKTTLKFASSDLMYKTESCIVRQDNTTSKVIHANEFDSSIKVDSIDNLLLHEKVNFFKNGC